MTKSITGLTIFIRIHCKKKAKVLQAGFGNQKYAPCPLLVNMVTAGKLGAKSGEGFYQYTAGSKELVVSSKFKK